MFSGFRAATFCSGPQGHIQGWGLWRLVNFDKELGALTLCRLVAGVFVACTELRFMCATEIHRGLRELGMEKHPTHLRYVLFLIYTTFLNP